MAEPEATKAEIEAWAVDTVHRREYATLSRQLKLALFEEWCNAKNIEARERIYADMMGVVRFETALVKAVGDHKLAERKAKS